MRSRLSRGGDHAGQVVVEGHTELEDGRSHEEIYVVLRGVARFLLDGEELEAPAGTFVLVSDPKVFRRAIATEPATSALPNTSSRVRPGTW